MLVKVFDFPAGRVPVQTGLRCGGIHGTALTNICHCFKTPQVLGTAQTLLRPGMLTASPERSSWATSGLQQTS